MKAQTDASTQTPEEILNELRAVVAEAEKILGNTSDMQSEGTMAALRERVDAAQERLAGLYEEAKRRVTAGAQYTDETIRANPYESLAIALGVGVLLGAVIGRYSKH